MNTNSLNQRQTVNFCNISFDNGHKWIQAIILNLNTEKNIIEIFLSSRNYNTYFNRSSKVIIKSLVDSNGSFFTGIIDKKIISLRNQTITVKICKMTNFLNTRKHERFDVDLMGTLRTSTSSLIHVNIQNISLGGVQIYTNKDIDKSEKLFIQVFSSTSKSIALNCRILRKKPYKNGFLYGTKIEEITEENYYLLNELLELLYIQRLNLYQELKVFNNFRIAVYLISTVLVLIIFYKIFK